jgi:sarcosine oxidase subunit alpha
MRGQPAGRDLRIGERLVTGSDMRLPHQPGEVIHRDKPVVFTWNGQPRQGLQGDTVVSALAAVGERIISRSFKYHRPRGLLSADEHDPNCFVQVGVEPNVPGASALVFDGAAARAQNAWPSLRYDIRAANAMLSPFIGAGFYYKTFIKPRWARPVYQRLLSKFSPGGHLGGETPSRQYAKRFIHHDVLVVGGGPAGMAAALSAADSGAEVVIVDEQRELGGHLRWGDDESLAVLAELRTRVHAHANIEVLVDSVVFGLYDDNWVGIHERGCSGEVAERLLKGRPGRIVIATGLLERPQLCAGNDVPGVMLSSAAQRLIGLYGVRPGRRAVLTGTDEQADSVAARLESAGVEVVRAGNEVRRVTGRRGVRSVVFGDGRRVQADLVVTCGGWSAQTALWSMAGGGLCFDAADDRFVPSGPDPDRVLTAGALNGDASLQELIADGEQTGRGQQVRRQPVSRRAAARHCAPDPKAVVDFSEDVTVKDIAAAVAEGYRSIELAKRYTTATMGPTQGKYTAINAAAAHARATGRTMDQTGTPTARPPYTPVSLGALAGRRYHPVRCTPMHSWHVQAGAVIAPAGQWLRPQHYGDAVAEAGAVRRGVGIIDVSTLGKFELVGSEVPRLLNALYVNRWSALPVGSVRYGAMCNDAGVVVDDGVTGRLSDARYIMSATSSGAADVARTIATHLQTDGADWDVAFTDLSDAYASVNVAGPRARTLLQRLVQDVDLTNDAFPYMRVRTGSIAEIPGCFIWRIGFTGELSYEIYVPAAYGLHVWQQLVSLGEDLGVVAFGVEALRTLRIEKGHAVVGQDSDALTGPFSIGLGGMTRLDKTETLGIAELTWQAANPAALPYTLVAVQPEDRAYVPEESAQIVHDGRSIGRITSSCMSPTLGRGVALAQVSPLFADAGTRLLIRRVDGSYASAAVLDGLAHVDPEGTKLRV